MRISYTDYKLYLSIFEAVSRQLNKAIKMEVKATEKEELPEHSFDGENVINVLVPFCFDPPCDAG